MIISEIASKARDLVNTNSTDYTDANLLLDINIWYQRVSTWILDSQDDSDFDDSNNTKYPIYTSPLIASQRDYPITPTLRILQEKRVDVSYDGVNYYRALPFDSSAEKRGMGPVSGATVQDSTTDARFSRTNPGYDIKYGSVFLYPLPTAADVAAGAQFNVEFTRAICPFTFTASDTPATTRKLYVGASTLGGGTVEPGFDINFHPILSYGPAQEFAEKYNAPQLSIISSKIKEYEQELRTFYGNKNKDMKWVMTPYDIPEDVYNR